MTRFLKSIWVTTLIVGEESEMSWMSLAKDLFLRVFLTGGFLFLGFALLIGLIRTPGTRGVSDILPIGMTVVGITMGFLTLLLALRTVVEMWKKFRARQ